MKVIVRHDTERIYSHADTCPGLPDCVHGDGDDERAPTCERCFEGPIRDVVEEEWTDGWRVCAACGDEARRLGLMVVRIQ